MATILVIDDDASIVEMLTGIFEDEGHTVYGAFGGRQGLTLASQLQPDLVLSDVAMPDVPGDLLCQTLQQQGWQKPIILMSANQVVIDPARCTPTAFVAKPFRLDDLLTVVHQSLADR